MRGAETQVVLANIAANLRRHRLRAELTQQDLAEKADLDLSYVQRVERAAENISVDSLVRLAKSVGIFPGALFKKATLAPPRRGRPPRRHKTTPSK